MTIHQIECFLEAAKTLNFTEAASRLYISQQGLSRQIASLEKELELRLFDRTTRDVRLTRSGELLLWRWKDIPAEIKDSVDMAREEGERAKRRINLSVVGMSGIIEMAANILADYMAFAPEVEFEINPKDLQIDTFRSSGAGGQHINKTDSAVRIEHVPTGITVNCQEGRSQHENRETALRLIRARVYEELTRQKEEEEGAVRRAKIGTGDRSEKIRTYNYPHNRVTDHRIGFTINQLDRIMEGKLDDVIAALLAEAQRQKLAGENNA